MIGRVSSERANSACLWLGAAPADRASQCPGDGEQAFGLPIVGARALVYGNHWFSVQARACTEIISFPYTPSDRDPPSSKFGLNQPQTAGIRKTVPFRTTRMRY